MSALDDNIVVDFDTGRDLKPRYIQSKQCKSCKRINCVDEFVSKHSKIIYNKICRACLEVCRKSRLKGKE